MSMASLPSRNIERVGCAKDNCKTSQDGTKRRSNGVENAFQHLRRLRRCPRSIGCVLACRYEGLPRWKLLLGRAIKMSESKKNAAGALQHRKTPASPVTVRAIPMDKTGRGRTAANRVVSRSTPLLLLKLLRVNSGAGECAA
jgi:hypothetical protein